MPEKIVRISPTQTIRFPSTMSEEEISSILQSNFSEQREDQLAQEEDILSIGPAPKPFSVTEEYIIPRSEALEKISPEALSKGRLDLILKPYKNISRGIDLIELLAAETGRQTGSYGMVSPTELTPLERAAAIGAGTEKISEDETLKTFFHRPIEQEETFATRLAASAVLDPLTYLPTSALKTAKELPILRGTGRLANQIRYEQFLEESKPILKELRKTQKGARIAEAWSKKELSDLLVKEPQVEEIPQIGTSIRKIGAGKSGAYYEKMPEATQEDLIFQTRAIPENELQIDADVLATGYPERAYITRGPSFFGKEDQRIIRTKAAPLTRENELIKGRQAPTKRVFVPDPHKQSMIEDISEEEKIGDITGLGGRIEQGTPFDPTKTAIKIIEGRTIPIVRKSGFYGSKALQEQPIKDVYSSTSHVREVALAQDALPESGGKFGAIYNEVYKPTQEAEATMVRFINDISDSAINIAKRNNINNNDIVDGIYLKKIMEIIPNRVLRQDSKILAEKYGFKENFVKAAQEYRILLDYVWRKNNTIRKAIGLEEIPYRESYVPLMQEADKWYKAILESDGGFVEGALPDWMLPSKIKNPHAMKRFDLIKEPEQNFFKLLDSYTGNSAKDIYITPAIERLKTNLEVLKSRGDAPNTVRFWEDYIKHNMLPESYAISGYTMGDKAKKVAMKIREARYKGALTANALWQFTTQPLSTPPLIISKTGLKNTIVGGLKYFTDSSLRKEIANTRGLIIKTGRGNMASMGAVIDTLNHKIYRSKIDRVNDFLSVSSNAIEKHLQGWSTAAGLERGRQLGYKGGDLIEFANNIGEATSVMFNRSSRPLLMNSDLVRTLSPFQSFSFEMFNRAKQLGLNTRGMTLTGRQRLGQGISLLAGMYVANSLSEKLIGRKQYTAGSFIPFVGGFVDQQVGKLTGDSTYGERQVVSVLEDVSDITDGMVEFVKYGDWQKLRKAAVFWGMGLGGLGGATQVNRIVDGLIANSKGEVSTASGKTSVELDSIDSLLAPVIGPWNTPSAVAKRRKEREKKKQKRLKELFGK